MDKRLACRAAVSILAPECSKGVPPRRGDAPTSLRFVSLPLGVPSWALLPVRLPWAAVRGTRLAPDQRSGVLDATRSAVGEGVGVARLGCPCASLYGAMGVRARASSSESRR